MNFTSKLSSSLKHIFSKPQLLYFFLAWALCAIEIWCIVGILGYKDLEPQSLRSFLYCIIWSGLFSLPYILLSKKWKWIQLLIYSIIVILNLVNILYLRNFSSFINIDTLFNFQGLNSFTITSGLDSLKIIDLIPIIALSLQIILFISIGNKNKVMSKIKYSLSIFLFAAWSGLEIYAICFTEKFELLGLKEPPSIETFCRLSSAQPQEYFRKVGFFETYCLQGIAKLLPKEKVSEKEKIYIQSIASGKYQSVLTSVLDSVTTNNKSKNLIFIVVESLNSEALGRQHNGLKYTPTLDSLVTANDVIIFDNMRQQISFGKSSDGQLMYNTGLLPLQNFITAYLISSVPSLAKELKKQNSIEIIGENINIWNHSVTSTSYGFNEITALGFWASESLNVDYKIFSVSLSKIAELKQPFFAFITSISMHEPYSKIQAPKGWPLSQQAYEYLVKTQIFDKALNQFLTGLKQKGLYDNSVIVLASDHAAPFTALPDKNVNDGRIMFMIINSGLKGGVNSSVIGQVDVYPTILDVMGVRNPTWPGLGTSLLREIPGFALMNDGSIVGDSTKVEAANRQRKAREITSKMILNKTIGTLAEPKNAN